MDLLDGFIIGLHLASVHVPAHDWQDNFNPGIYAQHVDTGITLGTYHNTLGRQTVYAGWTYNWGPASVTLGAATGYKKETKEVPCSAEWAKYYSRCTMTLGQSKSALVPMLAPSVKLPTVLGVTPRVSFIPGLAGSANVFHLSIEKTF